MISSRSLSTGSLTDNQDKITDTSNSSSSNSDNDSSSSSSSNSSTSSFEQGKLAQNSSKQFESPTSTAVTIEKSVAKTRALAPSQRHERTLDRGMLTACSLYGQ
eukprot:15451-Heterococcus_DN1.PRE.3